MTRIPCFSLALAALFLLTAGSAQAQRSQTRGLYLNAHLIAAGIGYDDEAFGTQSGGGLGVEVGYGVSRLVTLFLGVDGSVMSNATSVRFGAGLSWFPSRR
jgi:hypothetical protein